MVSLLKAEFEHVQLTAAYACSGWVSRGFLNEFKNIADCRLGIADLEEVGESKPSFNRQSAIGNRQLPRFVLLCLPQISQLVQGETDWQQKI
jgi:hypothetical protein